MIEVTVGLPLFNAKHIAWLALESLVRQKDISFEWELITAEEQNSSRFGKQNISLYSKKLKEIGCKRIENIELNKWIPLSKKWKLISESSSDCSKYFFFQGADNYTQPYRFSQTYKAFIENDADWVSYRKGLFYIIKTGEIIVCDHDEVKDKNIRFESGLNMSTKTEYMRLLPEDRVRYGVDFWLFKSIQNMNPNLKIIRLRPETWNLGLFTHGINNISLKRAPVLRSRYKRRLKERDLKGKIPDMILQKLKSYQKIARP